MATLIFKTDDWATWEEKLNAFIEEYNTTDFTDMSSPFQVNGNTLSGDVDANTEYGEIRLSWDYNAANYAKIQSLVGDSPDEVGLTFFTDDGGQLRALTLDHAGNMIHGGMDRAAGTHNFISGNSSIDVTGNYNWTGGEAPIVDGNRNITFGNDHDVTGNDNVLLSGDAGIITGNNNTGFSVSGNTVNGNRNVFGYIEGGGASIAGDENVIMHATNLVCSGDYNFVGISSGLATVSSDLCVLLNGTGCSISGSSNYSTIINGNSHAINNSTYSAVLSGDGNDLTDSNYSLVGGGTNNSIFATVGTSTNCAILGGGGNNILDSDYSIILGGTTNAIAGNHSLVGTGISNTITGDHSVIGAGDTNSILGSRSGILAGEDNDITSDYSAIAGGINNAIDSDYGFIGGGNGNDVSAGQYSGVISGTNNNVATSNAVIAGGSNNGISAATQSFVGGGYQNLISGGSASVVGSGVSNYIISGTNCGIFSGASNIINSAQRSAILGGFQNSIVAGNYSGILGGEECAINANHAFAFGRGANADEDGQLVISDSDTNDFSDTVDTTRTWLANQFNARYDGGFYFVTGYDGSGVPTSGAQLASASSAWAVLSDKNKKTDFKEVNHSETLDKFRTLDIQEFRYKAHKAKGKDTKYTGPMAQDWHKLFDHGEDCDQLAIDTLQSDGVIMSVIKGLIDEVDQLKKELKEIKK